MKKYKKLFDNSIIFAIGNLGNKLMSFLLVPLYTYTMSTSEYGLADVITFTTLMLLPSISLGINDAIVSFVIDSDYEDRDILQNAILLVTWSSVIGILLIPITYILGFGLLFGVLLYLNLVSKVFQNLFANYIRGIGKTKLYAWNSILYAGVVLVSSIMLLYVFNTGLIGYVLSQVIGSTVSIITLFFGGNIQFSIKNLKVEKKLIKRLVSFSLPLVPNNTIFWLVNTVSRYTVMLFVGVAANGIYAVAMKIPGLINLFSTIFSQAWQISAIQENKSDFKDKQKFYSSILKIYSLAQYFGVCIILVILKPMTLLLFESSYSSSWQLVPFLLFGAVYSSLNGFFGQIYIAEKKTLGMMKTTILPGISSIILNVILVYFIGLTGACIAQLLGWLVTLLYRIYDTRKTFSFPLNIKFHMKNHLFFGVQILFVFIINNSLYSFLCQTIMFVVFLIVNKKDISNPIKKVFRQKN